MFDMKEAIREVQESIYESFFTRAKEEQVRAIMLAGNAEFILRVWKGMESGDTEVSATVKILLEALTRYLPGQDDRDMGEK